MQILMQIFRKWLNRSLNFVQNVYTESVCKHTLQVLGTERVNFNQAVC